jgi:hypothetical protein
MHKKKKRMNIYIYIYLTSALTAMKLDEISDPESLSLHLPQLKTHNVTLFRGAAQRFLLLKCMRLDLLTAKANLFVFFKKKHTSLKLEGILILSSHFDLHQYLPKLLKFVKE